MNDLIERLKEHAQTDDGVSPYNASGPLLNEAADVLEAQAAIIAELVAALEVLDVSLTDQGYSDFGPMKVCVARALSKAKTLGNR